MSDIEIASLANVPVAVISVVAVIAPVTPRVLPLNVRFPSAVIAEVPVPVRTALSVKLEAPVPPFATDKSVVSAKLAAVKSFTWKSANAVSVIPVAVAADVVVTALTIF